MLLLLGDTKKIPHSGLVAEWDLRGGAGATIADLSGNGNTLTLAASAPTRSAAGLIFNGTSNYASAAHSTSLSLGTGAKTFIAIANMTDNAALRPIITKRVADAAPANYQFRLINAAGDDYFMVYYSNTTLVNSGAAVAAGVYQFLGGTYNPTGNVVKFYLRGIQSGTNKTLASGAASTSSVYIGWNGRAATNDSWFKGTISYILIYNRALSAAEIRQLYNFLKIYLRPSGISI